MRNTERFTVAERSQKENKQAKRANLPGGRDAKLQIQNGWLGCRLGKQRELLFGGISQRAISVKGDDGSGVRSRMSCLSFMNSREGGSL